MSRSFVTYLSVMGAMILWSISFVWSKEALEVFKPVSLISLRTLLSVIAMSPILFISTKLRKIKFADLKPFLLLALFEPVLYFIGEAYGLDEVSPATAAVIISTIPLFIPFAASFFLKEKISLFNLLGIIVSIVGVLLVVLNDNFQLEASFTGLMFLFLAVIAAIAYTLMLKKVSFKYGAFEITFLQNLLGVVYLVPLFFVLDFSHFSAIDFNLDIFIPVIQLAVLCSSLAFVFFSFAVKKLGASKAGVFTNAIPVLTLIFSYFLLDEDISSKRFLGIVIVISGLFISQVKPRKSILIK